MYAKALLTACLLAVLYCKTATGVEETDSSVSPLARLFLYKSKLNVPVVVDRDFVVFYHLINNGDLSATHIEVEDKYDPTSFIFKHNVNTDGSVRFSVDEVAPGATVTFNVTVKPKISGSYDSTRAQLSYTSGVFVADEADSLEERRKGTSASLGRLKIISTAEHLRRTSYNIKEWATFLGLYALACVTPFIFKI